MKVFLIEGFAEVVEGLGAAVKLFWPVAFIYLGVVTVSAVFGYFAMLDDTSNVAFFLIFVLTSLAAMIYVFLALCQGAVAWHRCVLLNEAAHWISPVPRLRSLKYAGSVLVFIIVFLIGHMMISSFTLPYLHSVFTSSLGDIDLTNAPAEQLEIWRKAVWPIQIATFTSAVILVSAILWFGRSWLLIFPHISIRSVEPAFGAIRERLSRPAGLVGALVIVYFLPSLLGVIYYASTPMSVQLLPVLHIAYVLLGIVLNFFCFLWGLSMLSIAYRQAQIDRMPYQELDHVAQN